MRRLYGDLLLRRLRAGDLAWPLRALRSGVGALLGEARPLLGTLIVTYRCDLDCAMCDLPSRGDRGREMDGEGLRGTLDAFRDLGVLGVGVTGGEPLLRPDTVDVIRHGVKRGLLMHLNTNGTLVTEETARALADAGLASVNLSLDGPDAETHDRLRGRPGSFARVLRAAARLLSVPRRPYRVALTCALGPGNADGVDALLARARDMGVDRVGFLPVHTPAGGVARPEPAAAEAAARLAARARKDPLLDNSPAYLGLFARAFAGAPNPVPCHAPRTSVVVDCYGTVYPCVPLNAARKPVGKGDVRALWRSEVYRKAREALQGCRACYWNCHTEMNLALGGRGASGKAVAPAKATAGEPAGEPGGAA
ncbi:MAG TPA: radical SAM protein [Planctomycetota bacterium]|nr:radical SAM protein [Planctomycetota bacterium]